MKALIWLFIATCLFGCAATVPKFENLQSTKSTVAVVYIYRMHNHSDRNAYPYIYIDGIQRDRLRDNGYVIYELEPGKRKISIESKGSLIWNAKNSFVLEPTLDANNLYFFELSVSSESRFEVFYSFQQVSELEALQKLKTLNLSQ